LPETVRVMVAGALGLKINKPLNIGSGFNVLFVDFAFI